MKGEKRRWKGMKEKMREDKEKMEGGKRERMNEGKGMWRNQMVNKRSEHGR